MITADYLIIGAGAVGMIFADEILTETDATIVMVDAHAAPGGHWNDAYPFVRLHQPSAFYGVGSRKLGADRIDTAGLNAGYYELASGPEILAYFDTVMRERFLPSGRVEYFPMCEYRGDGRFVSKTSCETFEVDVRRKIVDATFFKTAVPSTHKPAYEIADGVTLVTPNALPGAIGKHGRYTIVGGGKTSMDTAVWLLQMGASPDSIRWIRPRESWLLNRATTQPGDAFHNRFQGAIADQYEAAAAASSVDDLFARMERAGVMLRIDPSARPSMIHGATISQAEIDLLRRIKDVVRLGRVRKIMRDAIQLEQGKVKAEPGTLYIDCTARAVNNSGPPVPIFNGGTITPQALRNYIIPFSIAAIAHVEAAYEDDATKNALCVPVPIGDTPEDYPRGLLADLAIGQAWAGDRAIRQWAAKHRLTGFGTGLPDDPEAQAIRNRIRDSRVAAAAGLQRLMGQRAVERAV